ncbi:MAG: hypothetical protein H6837_09240 [Planctomycetes bacterium]|nr:hypothetical protein [Planctomycetota bacterium]
MSGHPGGPRRRGPRWALLALSALASCAVPMSRARMELLVGGALTDLQRPEGIPALAQATAEAPIGLLCVDIDDPTGIATPPVRAWFFFAFPEKLHERYWRGRVRAIGPEFLRSSLPSAVDSPWEQLARAEVRSAVCRALADAGQQVDYFVRGRLRPSGGDVMLELEAMHASSGAVHRSTSVQPRERKIGG